MNELQDAGFNDPFVGTELFRALRVPSYEFQNPIQLQKLKEVAEFLNNHPDPGYVISTLGRKATSMKPLDYLVSYARLNKERAQVKDQLDKYDKELKAYE